MLTLSHGFKKPQSTDTGDVVFPALEGNCQQLNDHLHNGVDSALLAVVTQNILHAAWVAAPAAGGLYKQTVTLPSGSGWALQYDSCQMEFRLSTGERVYPSIERASATTFVIYTNDNTLDYVGVYR